jgi:Uma2 family endonuclease
MLMVREIDEDRLYPASDGKRIADNTEHFDWIAMVKENLEILFRHQDVFIAADLFWYPQDSPMRMRTAPDVMVAFGRPKGDRQSYKQWREDNIPPTVVFEFLSHLNRDVEMARKLLFYQRHGVKEYYIYDLEAHVLEGLIRHENQLVKIAELNGWVSPHLGIKFDTSQEELVIYDPYGERFLTFLERWKELETIAKAEELAG